MSFSGQPPMAMTKLFKLLENLFFLVVVFTIAKPHNVYNSVATHKISVVPIPTF